MAKPLKVPGGKGRREGAALEAASVSERAADSMSDRHTRGHPEAVRQALRRTLVRALELASAAYPAGQRAPILEQLVAVAREADRRDAELRRAATGV